MSKGLNEIKIIGHVGQAPEVKNLDSGNKLVSLSVATSRTYKDSQGEKKTITQWHRVVAWRKLAEIVEKYVSKGDKVYFSGEMTYRNYETENGEKRSIAEINANDLLLLTPKSENSNSNQAPPTEQYQSSIPMADDDDDLPF